MSESARSVAFDRAADHYDRTRSLSPEAMGRVIELLRAELEGRGRCLEIGVGTGRIALPLAEAGISMAGVDLSQPMLAQLLGKSGGAPPFPIARADATLLPFGDAVFGTALAIHVLHLIPSWAGAIDEMLRVVRRPGIILVDLGRARGIMRVVEDRFAAEGGIGKRFSGLGEEDVPDLDRYLLGKGAALRELPEVVDRLMLSIDGLIQLLVGGVYSWTWRFDEETRRSVGAKVRAWATDTYGDLEEPRSMDRLVTIRAYDLS